MTARAVFSRCSAVHWLVSCSKYCRVNIPCVREIGSLGNKLCLWTYIIWSLYLWTYIIWSLYLWTYIPFEACIYGHIPFEACIYGHIPFEACIYGYISSEACIYGYISSEACIYGYISSEACVYHPKTDNQTLSQCRSFSGLISIRHFPKFRSPRFESCPVFCFLPHNNRSSSQTAWPESLTPTI